MKKTLNGERTNKKKLIGLTMLAAATAALLGACGNGSDSGASTSSNGKSSDTVTIGVLQPVEHGSLDAAYEGFKEGLAENGYKEGDNVTFEYSNAQNDQAQLKSMSEKLVKDKPALLLGIGTPAAQSLLNETTEIPMVVTAVTDPVDAKLVSSLEKPGGNVTGTTDMVSIDKQIELLLSIVPEAKTIGIMYNAGEPNSKIQADLAEEALTKAGVKTKVLTANSTNDVQQVTTSLAKDVDGIYIPTDNTFASAAAVIGDVAKELKVPIVPASTDQVTEGGLATIGIDYHALGKQTGEMAAKILKGDAAPADMPIESAADLELVVNEDMAKALGIDPDSIKAPE